MGIWQSRIPLFLCSRYVHSGIFNNFLTTITEYDPDPNAKTVPESVIQTSIKIVNEPQQSLKANLKRALANFGDDVCSC